MTEPVAPAERVIPIDVLRGTALCGVLLVNLLTGFRIPVSADLLRWTGSVGWQGELVYRVFRTVFEFKAFTLFSFLFGVGVAIQAGRAPHGNRRWFFARRFCALFAIGAIHMLFLWNGDILALYGTCGLAMIPLLGLPAAALMALGLGLIVWPNVAPLPFSFPAAATLEATARAALHAYGDGAWPELFAVRWRETRLVILPLLELSFPRTLGLMLLGVVAWRRGWMVDRRRLWTGAALGGGAVGIWGVWAGVDEAANIGLAMCYGAVVLLWFRRASSIAAAGRMALTNYLLQSIVFGFVFYGYGLGWIGKLGALATLLAGAGVYGLQLAFSVWWLKRFRFGPWEWLWRSVSYLRRQPFARTYIQ